MAVLGKIRDLETRLGHKFRDRALLERALTHASVQATRNGHNERLEFLGDRVLGLVIAELLTERFATASEGELARRYNRLVRRETCAKVARALKLGSFLNLSESEEESGGRDKDTILADACEAVLAAVFLEGGFVKARETVRRLWEDEVGRLPAETVDAKSALQEWAQGQGLDLPTYSEVARDGPDHAPRFTSEVKIKGRRPARGSGASKRIAEQAAATELLCREGVWSREPGSGEK